jgi:membrane peptidoglycan carboxypeptidase
MTYMGAHGKADWPPESPAVHIQDVDVTLRKAAEIGANGPFAQLGLAPDLGPTEVYDLATRMGIPSGTKDFVPVPALILGTAEATPLTMATVYATLADGGVRHDPVMVAQLLGKDGRVVWTPSAKSEQVLAPSAAQGVTDVLHSALTDGTTGTAVEPRTSAEAGTWAMAGAMDGAKAAWFDGADSHYVISVAVSKTDAKGTLLPLSADGHNGPDVGSRLAGPIWAGMVQTLRNQG